MIGGSYLRFICHYGLLFFGLMSWYFLVAGLSGILLRRTEETLVFGLFFVVSDFWVFDKNRNNMGLMLVGIFWYFLTLASIFQVYIGMS
jgi:hypothetical protein